MSLLIDALKQAEAARQRSEEGAAPTGPAEGMALTPIEARQAPEASPPLEPTAPAKSAAGTPRRARPADAPIRDGGAATRELFEVKRQAPNRWPYVLLGLCVLVLIAGGAYVWWATQPRSSLLAPGANLSVSAPQPIAESTAAPANNTPATVAPPVQTATTAASSSAGTLFQSAPAPRRTRVREPTTEQVPQEPALKFRAASNPPAGNAAPSATQAAYDALAAGDLRAARQLYQEALRQNPQNIDALNGLGLIAWRDNSPDQAERYFRAALRADPSDSVASAQLALLYADSDPANAEARLRNLIASQPSSAAAYFALGNVYSRQSRWPEAQQALFQAYSLDSNNPDVLFNLAVSLEHVRQPSLARQFYERALQARSTRPGSFDPAAAKARIDALGAR